MARVPLPYTTQNNLTHEISMKRANLIAEKNGIKVNIRDVEEELAEYCSISRDAIVLIKRGINQPSLAVALKISEYFGKDVREIFGLVHDEEGDKESK